MEGRKVKGKRQKAKVKKKLLKLYLFLTDITEKLLPFAFCLLP
jgi:hypothetical protein